MKSNVVNLGAASRKTRDFSGNNWFDALTFSFWRFYYRW
jgi:hypothetical protein